MSNKWKVQSAQLRWNLLSAAVVFTSFGVSATLGLHPTAAKAAPARPAAISPAPSQRSYGSEKVVPLRSSASKKMEVVVIHPKSMEDGNEITDTLLSGRAVVLNLEGISPDVAQRIIDYSAGSCYAMRGSLQKITNYIFLVAPSSVDISGDFQDMLGSGVDLSTTYQGNYF